METLTQSGAGVVVEPGAIEYPAFSDRLRDLVTKYRFVVVKRALPTAEAAVELMGRFGPLNEADTRKDGKVVVEDSDEQEVFRSRFALPLHKDGVLTGFDVVLVGIHCAGFEDVTGGRTYISDVGPALAEVPADLVAALREHGLEGMAVDATGYYREEYEAVWHHFPAFRPRANGGESLSIGMPHAEGEPESWRVRIAGVPAEESDRILGAMRTALLDERFTYHHDWEVGDLLLIDNCEVLHGREAWSGKDRRLANIQVLAA